MKKICSVALIAVAALATPLASRAFDLKNILGGGSSTVTDVVSSIVNEVTTTSNLQVSDLAGQWTIQGTAVGFESDNLLSKAGGMAAEQMVTKKLDPYFKKLGLTGAVFTIQTDGSFTLTSKKLSLSGTITKTSDGKFKFDFSSKLLGKSLASVNAKVEKNLSGMNILFDVKKAKDLLSAIAGIAKTNLTSTVTSVLNQYDGLYVGFNTTKTGTVSGEGTSTSTSTGTTNTNLPSADDIKSLFGK